MSEKKLVIERPHEDAEEHIYDEGSKRRFHLDEADIDMLEAGRVLWRGDVAFTLE